MPESMTRRQFVRGGVTAAATPLLAPAVLAPDAGLPVVVASANGNVFTNGGPRTCVAEVFERLVRGADVVDALVGGVAILEEDPLENSVGFGGLPNADGVVQLDASCMHGPKRRAGAVACLEGVRTPAAVARAVMQETDHHLLVGRDAQTFARQLGFRIEADLNTERSRRLWLEWKRRTDPDHYLDPEKRAKDAERARRSMIDGGLLDAAKVYGTIHCNAVGPKGELGGVTTTSGLAFKIPGRVGDSPILGAGNYVDGEVGAAGSTGRGEANLYSLASFVVVEAMRRGAHPKDAAIEALQRIRAATREKRLQNARGLPNFQVKFYAVNRRGEHAGVALWSGPEKIVYAVCTARGPETLPMDALLEGTPRDAA
jgi:N4-(beta-N-acetylglucosaminyl)-L-asparaginase